MYIIMYAHEMKWSLGIAFFAILIVIENFRKFKIDKLLVVSRIIIYLLN